jgi:dimethylargininase
MAREDAPRAALVGEVSPRLGEAELTFLAREPMDLALARRQHATYRQVLADAGLEVVVVPTGADQPDGVFVEDTVVVVEDTAVLTRPGAAVRRPEVARIRPLLADRGLAIVAIEPPGTLDGGDVLQVGTTAYVGRTTRTNAAGVEQLARHLAALGRRVVPVEVDGALHLKTAATSLPDGAIVAEPRWVDVAAFRDREVITVPEPAGANLLLLDAAVVVSARAPVTAELVTTRGFEVVTIDLSELEKAEAGPTCLSVLLPPVRDRSESPHPDPGSAGAVRPA